MFNSQFPAEGARLNIRQSDATYNSGECSMFRSSLSRRNLVALAATTAAGFGRASSQERSSIIRTDPGTLPPYGNGSIPAGIRSRAIANVNGLTVHMLEAGFDKPGRPAVLLLHGFPELAYSWRKVMLPLAAAGY